MKRLNTNKVPKNMTVIDIDDLKPEPEMTDEELLADAIRSAEEWSNNKNKNKNY